MTMHHGTKLARLGVVVALVSRTASRLLGIVLVVVLARWASTDTVAVYGYLLGTSSLVIALTDLGVASVVNREVAAGRLVAEGALRAALGPQALSLAVAATLTVVLTLTLGPARVPAGALALTVGCVLFGGMNNLYAELLRGAGRVLLEGALQLGSAAVVVVGGVLAVESGGGAVSLLAVVLCKEAGVLVVGVVLVRPRRLGAVSGWSLVRQSIGLAVAGTMLIVLWRQGMILIGAGGSVGALATYVVASRYLDAAVTLAHTAAFGLRPGLSALAGDRAAMGSAVRRYLGLAVGVGAAVALIGQVMAGRLVSAPFGDRWAGAVGAVRVIAVATLPVLVAFVALSALVACRRMRLVMVGSVAGTGTGLAVSLPLVWWHPDPVSALLGTAAGSAVLATVYVAGLRDLLLAGTVGGPRSRSSSRVAVRSTSKSVMTR